MKKVGAALEAVIFDLFGTLVLFSNDDWQESLSLMAAAFGAGRRTFKRLFLDSYAKRATGVYRSLPAYMTYLGRKLGRPVTKEHVAEAVRIRMDFARRSLVPRRDAEKTLRALKSAGLKIGLVSNCTMEIPSLWHKLPIAPYVDAPVFSCEVGRLKPDPSIYRIVSRRLRVSLAGCLFVGDGDSDELDGAAKVGMRPVLIRIPPPYGDARLQHAIVKKWRGLIIGDLSEVIALVR